MSKLEQIVENLSQLTLLEASELAKMLEEKWGVSAAAPAMIPAVGTVVAEAEAPVVQEEQTEFDVILTGFGDKKINVIKEVRSITNLGLKEAKELVEGVPKPVKEAVNQEEAAKIKEKLEAAGASVTIK